MIVYKITNKINGKAYIGQTVQTLSKRWNRHVHNKSKNSVISLAIRKYGVENFEIRILSRCNTIEEMNHRETYYIKLFNTLATNGYNLKLGGQQGGPLTELSKQKISNAKKGKPSAFFGKRHSEESKIKNSIAHLGRKASIETRQKQSKALKGKSRSQESINKAKKPVICIETGVIYPSVKEAGEAFGVVDKAIRRVLKGERKKYKGLTFSYYGDKNVTA